ncbi:MAG: tRNA (adenosine(37)-N6)-threonylcarbamoyltransferase complex ATPase subunit type 1 TsaE [Alphaproteobacteria bacterium]|nr:tRNA (adenosine(37)-N6)-threonylcarbamoyltransferase complex ATPase subunit type 1 TsaE [Alphaproteobacteria bacterium]
MKQFISKTEEETFKIAAQLAKTATPGMVFALYGTLGAGKSAFCRGFIQSLCPLVQDVPSPTFTILQTYESKDFDIYHFDMYRLKKEEEAFEIGIEDAFIDGVSLIEWPEKIGYLLPKNAIKITILIQEDQSRLITVEE